jgi:L-alanine-DL-glutamate epimerase-like enolase superfamily enzyme
VAAAAAAAVGQGFTVAKLKVSPDLDASVARVAAVRAAAPRLALRVDCNGSCDPERAVALATRLVPYGLEWLEQPVRADDVAGLARVRRDGGVPVAADESVTGCEAVAALAAAGAADAVVLKLVQVGGLARALAAGRAAAAAGLALTVTTAIDTSIGTAAALHLGCALPEPGLGIDLDPAALARWRTETPS